MSVCIMSVAWCECVYVFVLIFSESGSTTCEVEWGEGGGSDEGG